MLLRHTPGSLKRFRKTPLRFQKTFPTPLEDLPRFVSCILSAHDSMTGGCLTIDQTVFEPKHLVALLAKQSLPPECDRDWSVIAETRAEVSELLEAALGDWMGFAFAPTPKPFVIYADHDEYTTFYANTKSGLNIVVEPLLAAGFKQIPDFEREF